MTELQQDAAARQEEMRRHRRRWTIVGLLAVLAFINYADRAALGVAAKPIMDELGFSAAAFGAISAAFSLGYIPANLLGGIAGDKFGAVRVLRVTVAIWSITVASLAFAYSYTAFLLNRLIFGASEGPNFALDNKLIANWTSPVERGRALAVVTVGIPLGTALATPLVGVLVAVSGWRMSFVILGVLGLLWIAVSWPLLKEAPERAPASPGEPTAVDGEPETMPWREVLSNWSIWALVGAAFCGSYFSFTLITWLPEYFRQAVGFSVTSSAFASSAPWAGAAAGILVTGLLSDRILRRTGSIRWARSGVLGVGLLCSAVCLALTAYTTSVFLNVTLMSLAAFFAYPSVTNLLFGIVASIVPAGSVASVTGMVVGLAVLGGLSGPFVTGVLVDVAGGFTAALLAAAALTAVGGLLAIFGVRLGARSPATPPTGA